MCFFLVCKIMFSDTSLVSKETMERILDFFTVAVALIIVAVPEGLPLSISIAMAFSIDTLKKDKLLVKQLKAMEEMGSITEICTGKTATLTNNDLQVHSFYTAGRFVAGVPHNVLNIDNFSPNVAQYIKEQIIYNCDARIEMSDDAFYVPEGNGIERGMLKFL
jgi:P-type E1-E2 ATPase